MNSDAMHSPCLSAVLLARVLANILFWLYFEPSGLVTCLATPPLDDDAGPVAGDMHLFIDSNGAPTAVAYLTLNIAALAGNSAWNGRVWTLVGATAAFLQAGLFASNDLAHCFADLEGLGILGAAVAGVFLLYDVVSVLLYVWVLLAWVFGCGDFPRTPCCRLEATRPQPMYDGGGCCRSDGCILDCGRGRVPLPAYSSVVGRTSGIVEDDDPVAVRLRKIVAGTQSPVEVELPSRAAPSTLRSRAAAAPPAAAATDEREVTVPATGAPLGCGAAHGRPAPASAPPSVSSSPLPAAARATLASRAEQRPLVDESGLPRQGGAPAPRRYGTPGPGPGFAPGPPGPTSAPRGEAEGRVADGGAACDDGGEMGQQEDDIDADADADADAEADPVVWHTPAVVGAWRLVQLPSRLWLGVFASLTVTLSLVGVMGYVAWLLTQLVELWTEQMQQMQQQAADVDDDASMAQLELMFLLLALLVVLLTAVWQALVAAAAVMAVAATGSAVWHLVRFRAQADSLARSGHCDTSPLSKMRAAGISPTRGKAADRSASAAAGDAAGTCAAQVLSRVAVFLEPDALVPAALWRPLWRRMRPPPQNASPEDEAETAELEEAAAVEQAAVEAMEEAVEGGSAAASDGRPPAGPAACASTAHSGVVGSAGPAAGGIRAARVSAALALKRPQAGAAPSPQGGSKAGAAAAASALAKQAAEAARRTVALTRLALRRKHRWSARPLGFIHDLPLGKFPAERATGFVGAYTANVLVSAVLLGLAMFVFVFLVAFEFTRGWITSLIVVQLITLGVRTAQRILFRWFIVGRDGPSRLRCFACCDTTLSLTFSAVSGLFTGLSRVLMIALVNLVFSLRVDAPLIPSMFATLDAGFVSWAAMLRTRAEAEAYGTDKDETLARWCCIPRPLEVDVDEPWQACPFMSRLGCGTGGAVRSPAETATSFKESRTGSSGTGPRTRISV
ncbi:hypothetical protein FNF29_01898 [Cafeteria roenbergensis]|uniref:Uncharacterized protein n=1 Tax=Cafeteria roenbergensis TaxID=33653 RepID=A0A5A8CRH4_CAFRO|nr:hypothetical protein FNF29_01898 [Cafeteria roenbergensis]|eukprot:KAA0155147.1 hypothetical protein FNF29_01898 [Cafeteria roenbergensis]